MTGLELAAIARDVIPPVGATSAVATVDHRPGDRPGTGTTRWQARWFDGRRHLGPIGPAFERQRDMLRLVSIVNGSDRPGSRRPAASDLASSTTWGLPAGEQGRDEPACEVSGRTSMPASHDPPRDGAGPRLCDGCDRPLPQDSRPNRRTHGPACRVAALRRRAAAAPAPGQPADFRVSADEDGGTSSVTLSGPSEPRVRPLETSPSIADALEGAVTTVHPDPVSSSDVEKARALGSASEREPRSQPVPEEPTGPPPSGQ